MNEIEEFKKYLQAEDRSALTITRLSHRCAAVYFVV